jgi:hypothetical protein
MTESPIVDAIRQSIREAGGLAGYVSASDERLDEIECQLAERFQVAPHTISAAQSVVWESLAALKEPAMCVAVACGTIEYAYSRGDDERCRELLQQLADDLATASYKGKRRRR